VTSGSGACTTDSSRERRSRKLIRSSKMCVGRHRRPDVYPAEPMRRIARHDRVHSDPHDRHWPATPGRPAQRQRSPRRPARRAARPVAGRRSGARVAQHPPTRAAESTRDGLVDLWLSANCPQDVRRRPTAANAAKRYMSSSERMQRPSAQVGDACVQNPAYRPARPPRTSPSAPAGGRIGFTRKHALAVSLGFSMLPDVRHPSDGPGVDLSCRSLVGVSSVVISSRPCSRLGVP
jgi:hypothetical protein